MYCKMRAGYAQTVERTVYATVWVWMCQWAQVRRNVMLRGRKEGNG